MLARRQLVVCQALIDRAVALLQRDQIMVWKSLGRIGDTFIGRMPAGEILVLDRVRLSECLIGGAEGNEDTESG
jgi:hypothetical protein